MNSLNQENMLLQGKNATIEKELDYYKSKLLTIEETFTEYRAKQIAFEYKVSTKLKNFIDQIKVKDHMLQIYDKKFKQIIVELSKYKKSNTKIERLLKDIQSFESNDPNQRFDTSSIFTDPKENDDEEIVLKTIKIEKKSKNISKTDDDIKEEVKENIFMKDAIVDLAQNNYLMKKSLTEIEGRNKELMNMLNEFNKGKNITNTILEDDVIQIINEEGVRENKK